MTVALGIAVLVAIVIAASLGIRGLSAAGNTAAIEVSPKSTTRIYYQPTPVNITINVSNLSGAALTPVRGYQYALTWNPAVLKWVSGPKVGPGTPTPVPVLSCSNQPQIVTWGTPTYTPTDFVPTYTPTATNTPGPGTPTNTPTHTYTPSMTPTPGGYIKVGCATISNATPVPNGVVGTFKFEPIATGQASSPLNLIDVMMLNAQGTPVVPPPTITSGSVLLADCHDVNGDGMVNIIDLSLVAAHFLTTVGHPNYDPQYDVNDDGAINIIDMSLVAAGFLQVC